MAQTAQALTKSNDTNVQFFDLFDIKEIQKLQDLFSAASKVSSVIMDLDGNMLTKPSNFTPLCKMIIDKTPSKSPACFTFDQLKKEKKRLFQYGCITMPDKWLLV